MTLMNTNWSLVSPLNVSDCIGESCSSAHTSSSSSPPTSLRPPSSRPRSLLPPQSFLGRLTRVGSSNGGDRKHRDASAVLPFIGLTDSEFTPTLWMYRQGRQGRWGSIQSVKEFISLLTEGRQTCLSFAFFFHWGLSNLIHELHLCETVVEMILGWFDETQLRSSGTSRRVESSRGSVVFSGYFHT